MMLEGRSREDAIALDNFTEFTKFYIRKKMKCEVFAFRITYIYSVTVTIIIIRII